MFADEVIAVTSHRNEPTSVEHSMKKEAKSQIASEAEKRKGLPNGHELLAAMIEESKVSKAKVLAKLGDNPDGSRVWLHRLLKKDRSVSYLDLEYVANAIESAGGPRADLLICKAMLRLMKERFANPDLTDISKLVKKLAKELKNE